MPATASFDYAIVRIVPYVEREEFVNVGVILFCRTRRYLAAQVELNTERVTALSPEFDLNQAKELLELIPRICAGDDSPIGQLEQAERFHWLVTPRSTSIQVSPVHSGICTNPEESLEHLMDTMVRID